MNFDPPMSTSANFFPESVQRSTRGAIGGKTGKTTVFPCFCKIEPHGVGAPPCYRGLSLPRRAACWWSPCRWFKWFRLVLWNFNQTLSSKWPWNQKVGLIVYVARVRYVSPWLTKGQLVWKWFLGSLIFSKRRMNEFDFTTSFVFWRKLTTPKNHFQINWPLNCIGGWCLVMPQ